KLVTAGRAAVKSGVLEDIIAADLNFHMWTYRVAGNPLIVDTMTLCWAHLRRAMGEILRQPGSREEIWNEHEAILNAIVNRDAKLAAGYARDHVVNASMRVAESVPASSQSRAGARV